MPNSDPDNRKQTPPPVYDPTNREASALSELHIALTHSSECPSWKHSMHCYNKPFHEALDSPDAEQSQQVWYDDEKWAVQNRSTLACWVQDADRLKRLLEYNQMTASDALQSMRPYGQTKPEESLEQLLALLRQSRPPAIATTDQETTNSERMPLSARPTLEAWLSHPDRAEVNAMPWYSVRQDAVQAHIQEAEKQPGIMARVRAGSMRRRRPTLHKAPSTYNLRRKAVGDGTPRGDSSKADADAHADANADAQNGQAGESASPGDSMKGMVDLRASRETFDTALDDPPPAYVDTENDCEEPGNAGEASYTGSSEVSKDREYSGTSVAAQEGGPSGTVPAADFEGRQKSDNDMDHDDVSAWARARPRKPVPQRQRQFPEVPLTLVDVDEPIVPAHGKEPGHNPFSNDIEHSADTNPVSVSAEMPVTPPVAVSKEGQGGSQSDSATLVQAQRADEGKVSSNPPSPSLCRPTGSIGSSARRLYSGPAPTAFDGRSMHTTGDDSAQPAELKAEEVLTVLPPLPGCPAPADTLEPPRSTRRWGWRQILLAASSVAAAVGIGYLYFRGGSSEAGAAQWLGDWSGRILGTSRGGTSTDTKTISSLGSAGEQLGAGMLAMSPVLLTVVGVGRETGVGMAYPMPLPDR